MTRKRFPRLVAALSRVVSMRADLNAEQCPAFLAEEECSLTSFDSDRNSKYASNLTQAIKAFNKSFTSVSSPNQVGASVQSAWIPAFSDSVTAYWKQYHTALAMLSLQTKSDLIKQLKTETVWPNYENIVTEPIAAPTPH